MQRAVHVEDFDRSVESIPNQIADRMVHEPLRFIAELTRMPALRHRSAEHGLALALIAT